MGTSRFILWLCYCVIAEMSHAKVTPSSTIQRRPMDPTDLGVLNKEVRAALLDKVNAELHAAETYMSSLEPQLTDCRVKVNASLGICAQCVDTECQKKYKDCQSFSIDMNTNGGSLISTTSVNGKTEIKICSMTGLQDVCKIIMNPSGFLINGISQIGNHLQINLQKLTNSLGDGTVGTFISGLQSVPNGTLWSKEDAAEFNAQMNKLSESLHNMGQNLQSSMHSMTTGLHHSLSGLMDGLHHSLGGIGQGLQNWGTNFAHDLSNSLSNMFQGTFLGRRKKRAAPQYCQALMSDVSSCSMFTKQCASCPSTVSKDLMASVCGQTLVNKVQAAEKTMKEVQQISKEVMSTSNLLLQVKGTPLHQVSAAYNNVVVTAIVRGQPQTFSVTNDIDTSHLKRAGIQIANQIWKKWAIHTSQP